VSYIGNGQTTGPVPLIPIGAGMRVMPSLGYALTPYGQDWTIRTAFQQERRAESRERRITGVAVRIGNTGASSTWGITARAADVLHMWRLGVALKLDIWRQPELLAEHLTDELESGVGAIATTVVPMPRMLRSRWSDGVEIAAGYKSQGYVPGEHLSGGAVLRVGLTMR
jgi:hypothetical protein